MVPLFAPAQVTDVVTTVEVIFVPPVSVTEAVPPQSNASVKVIVYAPADNPVNVLLA